MSNFACDKPQDLSGERPSAPLPIAAEKGESPAAVNNTYGQILKSSMLIGGSSVLNVGIGIVRTKALAVLLGPAGFGLFGLYTSIVNVSQCMAGMGINSSGVRQIAHAAGSGNTERIAQTAAVLRRASILLGVLGAFFLAAFSRRISNLTFGNEHHASAVSLLSIAVFFQTVSNGQSALIQGMRRVLDLAKIGALGALFGTLISIPVVYFLRERGVAPSLVLLALMSLSVSWWYSRKIPIRTPLMPISLVAQEAFPLLKLGFVFMTSGLLSLGMAYVVRILVLRNVGLEAIGLYQSAWALGGFSVGFILQTMAADFYPRLTASAQDNSACNRLVNEQTQVGILLAGPCMIATIALAPAVIALFYSTKFGGAVPVLRWICLGNILQVITWPMSYIPVAKGRQSIFFGTELALAVVSLSLAWICVKWFGLNGAGIAFFASNVFYGLLILLTVRRLSGFHWSKANGRAALLFFSLTAMVFLAFYVLPFLWTIGLGALATLLSAVYSIRAFVRLVPWNRIPRVIQQLLIGFNAAPSGNAIAD